MDLDTLLAHLESTAGVSGTSLHPDDWQWSELFRDYLGKHSRVFRGCPCIGTEATTGQCHRKSAEWAREHGGTFWSGYALSEGEWVTHSWAVHRGSLVVECTPIARTVYVGVRRLLTRRELIGSRLNVGPSVLETVEERRLRKRLAEPSFTSCP
jgi:hypothetical protein